MSDTIRWCSTHSDMAYKWADYCRDEQGNAIDCDVADALLIRADTTVYRIDQMYASTTEVGDHGRMHFEGVLVRIQGGDDE